MDQFSVVKTPFSGSKLGCQNHAKYCKYPYQYLQRRQLNKDLHPFYTPVEIYRATKYYIPTKCQNISPSREDEPGEAHAFITKEELIPFFLRKAFKLGNDDYRFYILLADAGMGKTTFLINLYLRYRSQLFHKRYNIKLLPLSLPQIDDEIDKIDDEEKEKTILLLDAFDEDDNALENYKQRLNILLAKIWRFREVVITCRTQFFPSEDDEPLTTEIPKFGVDRGKHSFRKLYISPFDDRDIHRYLNKKFSILQFSRKRKAKQIVKHSPSLMVRPMLLSYIDDLLEDEQRYQYTYAIYQKLINKWIEREANRTMATTKDAYQRELYRFSKTIAVEIYNNRRKQHRLSISAKEIAPFAEKYHIRLSEMEMKSRSLLNRNAHGEYKFSHKSILEYFLAVELFINQRFGQHFNFEEMKQAEIFYTELLWERKIVPFFRNGHRGHYKTATGQMGDLSDLKLDDIPKLVFLALGDVDELNLVVLRNSPKLRILALRNCNIVSLSPLGDLRGLEILYLDANRIKDIDSLAKVTRLKTLKYSSNQLTKPQIVALQKMLPHCHFSVYERKNETLINTSRAVAAYREDFGLIGK